MAIGSAWLPWFMSSSDPTQTVAWGKAIDWTDSSFGLANGYFLIAAGAVAAVCGLLLLLGMARSPGARMVLGIGAIAGAIGVGVVDFSAYSKVNDTLNAYSAYGASSGFTFGFGLFVGAGGAVVAALGGLLSMSSRPAATR